MRASLLILVMSIGCSSVASEAGGPTQLDASVAVGGDAATTDASAGPAHHPLLKAGLHPDASDALRALGITTDRISQTIGNAPASAGTHGVDGTADGLPFSAATDLRTGGMTETAIAYELEALGTAGFAAWYRQTGRDGWSGVTHIHVVWVSVGIKHSLRDQAHDYCNWKNGLVSHAIYTFHHFSQAAIDEVRARFLAHNPAVN